MHSISTFNFLRVSLLILVGNSCEIEFVRFLIEKLAIALAIGHFYSEKLAYSSLRKTRYELIKVPLSFNNNYKDR